MEGITLPRAIGVIVVVSAAFTLLSAALMLIVDAKTYTNFGDACWWAIQTVSTVGYGDDVPQSDAGRVLATVVMLFGIALVPTITSIVVTVLIGQRRPTRDE